MTDAYAADELTHWWILAIRRTVLRRAMVIACLVGTVLALVNHGDKILSGTMTWLNLGQVFVTYFVPYLVSTYSSVVAIRTQQRNAMAKRNAIGSE